MAAWVVGALFALAMVFGWSFETFDSAEPIVSSPLSLALAAVVLVVIAVAARAAACCVFRVLDGALGGPDRRPAAADRGRGRPVPIRWLEERVRPVLARLGRLVDGHPFAGAAAVLAACWLPVLIGYAPALFMWDTDTQILQWFGLPNHISASVELLDPAVLVTQHHPPLHTALVGLCVQLGLALGDENVGVFIYALLQWSLDVAVVAWAHRMLAAMGAPRRARRLMLAFVCIVPVYSNYSVLVTKDVMFAQALLLMAVELAWLVRVSALRRAGAAGAPSFSARHVALLALAAILVVLLRSGMIVVVVAGMAVALVLARGLRRVAAAVLAASLLVQLVAGGVVYPALSITPVSRREALSIPFQQVARFMRDNPGKVTEEDRAAIDRVLDADAIARLYRPDDADDVKATFRKDATAEDLSAFFSVWLRWFAEDPGCYLSSLAANYYGYFYPGTANNWSYTSDFSRRAMSNTDTTVYYSDIGSYFDFAAPSDPVVRALDALCSSYRGFFEFTPVLGLLLRSATYSWALVLLTAYAAHRRVGAAAAVLVPLWLVLLIAFTGPMNGTTYFRYEYPVAFVLPFAAALMTSYRRSVLNYEKDERM